MYTVMIADNEAVIREGLAGMIARLDLPLEVRWAARDGAEAIHMIEEEPPDILITDIRMPEMDGLELCAYVHEAYPDIPLILLTGFPDFAYAKQAIQYDVIDFVLKPTDAELLKNALEKACLRIQERTGARGESLRYRQLMFLQTLLVQNRYSALYTLNKLNELCLDLTEYHVLCATVLAAEGEDAAKKVPGARQILEEALSSFRPYVLPKSDSSFYVVATQGSPGSLAAACSKAAEACAFSESYDLAIGLSSRYRDPLRLREAATEADDACLFTASEGQSGLADYRNLPKLSAEVLPQITAALRDVRIALEKGNETGLSHALEAFFTLLKHLRLPFSGMQRTCLLLSHACTALLADHLLVEEELSLESDALSASDPDTLAQKVTWQVENTFHRLHASSGSEEDFVRQVRSYIGQHYADPLFLDKLAGEVHLSPGYVSRRFKKEAGCTLSAYILSVRMQEACRLLRTTSKKTYEIAGLVGIQDPVYFSKLFKKTYGMKPSEFRRG